MLRKIRESWKIWKYAGVTKETFYSCIDEIEQYNEEALGKAAMLSVVLFAVYCVAGCYIESFYQILPFYIVLLMISLLFYMIYRHFMMMGRCKFIMCYGYIGFLLGFALIREVFLHPQWTGALFHMILTVIFVLFILPFWKTVCFILGSAAVYAVSDYFMKEPEIFQLDMGNLFAAFCMSLLAAYLINHVRLSQLLARRQLLDSSSVDELTGIFNRRNFNRKITSCYEPERTMALLMIDVDNFKGYNDSYGHLAGDRCLSRIGGALERLAAETGCYPARYGGEEFVLLGVGKDLREIRQIGWKAVSEVRKLQIENKNSPLGIITISVGAAEKRPDIMKCYTDLINAADEALYQAKGAGKNRVRAQGD